MATYLRSTGRPFTRVPGRAAGSGTNSALAVRGVNYDTDRGCCTFRGAEDLGGTGFLVVDWSVSPPELREGTVRDEQVQADYLDELLTIFESEGVHGAVVYDFIQPGSPHISEAPQYDYDTASSRALLATSSCF